MAYKSLTAKYCVNRAAALTAIWTILGDMGWTLHDNMDGSSYRIYSSNAEDSSRITEYIRIDWGTTDKIGFIGYYYWNNSNHTGLGATYNATKLDTLTTSESGFYLWVYGNKNLVLIVNKIATTYYHNLFGFIPKTIWTVESNLTQAATSGSNVTLTLESTTGFLAGRQYQMIGATAEGRDTLTVSSITNSTQLVVSSLPRNYSSGSKFGEAPSRFCGASATTSSVATVFMTCPFSASGTTNATTSEQFNTSRSFSSANATFITAYDPDARGGQRLLCPINFSEYYASDSHSFIGYCDEFLLYAPTTGLTVEDTIGVGQQDTGTATSGGDNALNDTTKNWTTNVYQGKAVIIAAGLGAGQIRKIASNSQTQLVTAGDVWSIDATSSYRIVDEAYRYMTRHTDMPFVCREGA